MVLRIAQSAFRHGITEARIVYIVKNCPLPLYVEPTATRGERVLFLWHDLNGVPLEVVIHAMRMRRSFESRLLEVLGSQKR